MMYTAGSRSTGKYSHTCWPARMVLQKSSIPAEISVKTPGWASKLRRSPGASTALLSAMLDDCLPG
jgi:hypothetical protein